MISITTNLGSMIVQNSLNKATLGLNNATERMTTGYKINHAKDNAANYSINTNLSTKISSFLVAEDNVAMGLDLLTTASDSLNQIDDKLARLRALAEQAANGTYGEDSLKAINSEANAIVDEIERLSKTTSYNGIDVFKTNDYVDAIQLTEMDSAVAITEGTYSISTAQELAQLAEMTNAGLIGEDAVFVLTNDISLKDYQTGEGWVPIGDNTNRFKATFDGNGHVISDLYINRIANFQGLFGRAENAEIKNVGVINADVTGATATGGLVGCTDGAIVSNCYATGTVNGSERVGGLVGNAQKTSKINNSYSTVDVTSSGNVVGGLVGYAGVTSVEIINCYAKGNVSGNERVGGLVGSVETTSKIQNCYATGDVKATGIYSGGLVGYLGASTVTGCYSTGNVTAESYRAGGFAGNIQENSIVTNCYSTGDVIGTTQVGGFSGFTAGSTITDCKTTSKVTASTTEYIGTFVGLNMFVVPATYSNCEYYSSINSGLDAVGDGTYGTGGSAGIIEKTELPTFDFNKLSIKVDPTSSIVHSNTEVGLQVGIDGAESSQISVTTSCALDFLGGLRQIGLDKNTDFLSQIDNLASRVSSKQVEYGAAQNRLESALEQISVSYENLVSSQSTIRDADIAKESSEFIRNQILQQAAATLMATANQTPAIALQLI